MHDRRLAARAGELKPSAVRELLKHSKLPGVISLGGGIPAPELFDTEGLELAVQKVMSERFNDAFQYGLTEGYPPLRQAVSEICHSRGVACSAAQVYITSGSQQSLDIVARTLLDPGDTIVVERPTYLAALQVFQLAQANILSVDTDDDGMLVEQLADLLETTRVKAVYLVPTFGNPGGKTLSEARRRRLVELAKNMISSFWKTIPTAKLALLTPFGARSISMLSSWAVKIRWFTPRLFENPRARDAHRLDRHAGLAGAADGDCEAGGGSAYQYAVAGDHCGIPQSEPAG